MRMSLCALTAEPSKGGDWISSSLNLERRYTPVKDRSPSVNNHNLRSQTRYFNSLLSQPKISPSMESAIKYHSNCFDEGLSPETSGLENSLWWQIYTINSGDKTKLSCNIPHRRSTTVSLETAPLFCILHIIIPLRNILVNYPLWDSLNGLRVEVSLSKYAKFVALLLSFLDRFYICNHVMFLWFFL